MIITMVMMTMIAMVVEVVDGDDDHNFCQAALTSIDPGLHFATMFQEALFRYVGGHIFAQLGG